MVDLPDAADESQTDRDGFLSYAGEWHGLGVGFVLMLADPQLLAAVAAYAVRGSGGKIRSGHVKDAGKELGYTALGAALAVLVKASGYV